jgi:hypothetical protein
VSKTAFSGVWRQILKNKLLKIRHFIASYQSITVLRARRIRPNETTSFTDLSNLPNSRIDVLADFNQQQ